MTIKDKIDINKTIATIKLKKFTGFLKNLECSIGKKLLHDTIIMEGLVDIINGDTVIHGKNSVVDQGLIWIVNCLGLHGFGGYPYAGSYNWSSMTYSYMVIGSDTTTHTANNTNALSTPIGTAPGTKASSQTGSTSNPASGQWQVQWTSTWIAGSIPAVTLGEVGLYLNMIPTLQPFQGNSAYPLAPYMFSRMASADGKFSSFPINNTVPLSIAWTFRLTYSI